MKLKILVLIAVAMLIAYSGCSKKKRGIDVEAVQEQHQQMMTQNQEEQAQQPAPLPTKFIEVEFTDGTTRNYDTDCVNTNPTAELVIYVRGCGSPDPKEDILFHIPINSIKTWRAVK